MLPHPPDATPAESPEAGGPGYRWAGLVLGASAFVAMLAVDPTAGLGPQGWRVAAAVLLMLPIAASVVAAIGRPA